MNAIDVNTRFFYTGGALPPEAPSYIPRAADDQLFERLLKGDYCYVLVSRQMGKSSLMVHTLTRLVQRNIKAVMVDLNSIGDDTTQEQWYYSLTAQLAEQLGKSAEIDAFWDRSQGKTALQKWVGALEQLLRLYSERSLVIFIDEIDQVRSLPFKTDEFFAAIRSFHNRRALDANFKRLTFCLIGVALPSDLIEDPRITPFNIAERIDLTDFTEEQVVALKPGLQREEIQDEVLLQRVFYWTNGHPYLTQRLCRAIVEDSAVQTAQDVDRLCGRLFLGTEASTPDDNVNLVSARLLHSDPDVAGLLTLLQRIAQGKNVPYDKANRLINVLVLAGSLRSLGGSLQIRNRIYARVFDATWISDNMPDSEKRRLNEARRKGRLQAAAIALPIVLLLSALTTLAIFYAKQAHEAVRKAGKAIGTANTLLYISDMNQIQQVWESTQDGDRVKEMLDETSTLTDIDGKLCRGFEWSYWRRVNSSFCGVIDGHANAVYSVAFSPDGQRIVTGSEDKTAKLWDSQTGKELQTFKGHAGPVYSVAFSPDGHRIVTGSGDKTAKLWDIRTGKELQTFKGHANAVNSVAFSPDGQRIVTGSDDKTAKLWDVRSGKELRAFKGHTGDVQSVGFSSDGKRIVTGSYDQTAKVWDTQTGKDLLTLRGHANWVSAVAISPDGRRILTGSPDKTAKLWDAQSGKELRTFKGHASIIAAVAFSPDGKRIVTGSYDQTAKLWDTQTGKELLTLKGYASSIYSVAFSPDGQRVVTGNGNSTAKVWKVQIGAGSVDLRRYHRGESIVAVSPNGKYVFTERGSKVNEKGSETAKLWDAQSGKELLTFKGHAAFITTVAFSPDSKRIVISNTDKIMKLWDIQMGKEVLTFKGCAGLVNSVAFSPDGQRIVTGSEDKTAKMWDIQMGKELQAFKGHAGPVFSVAFSPDGHRIVTGSGDKTAKLWDVPSGKELQTFKGHEGLVSAVALSPDGRRIVTGSTDKTAKLWDVQAGKELLTFKGHALTVKSVVFSSDGKRIVTGSNDQSAMIWTAQ